MGLFRRSPSPAVPLQTAGQQQNETTSSREVNPRLAVDYRQQYSNPNSALSSPNLSLEHTRSRSPMPSNNKPDNSVNSSSPWTGYLTEGQYASADDKSKKSRSKSNKRDDEKTRASPPMQDCKKVASPPVVELQKLDLGSGSNRASTVDLARFSINGMLSLVEQRISLEERQQASYQKNAGLGLSVGGSSSTSRTMRNNSNTSVPQSSSSKRTMHTLGEDEEILCTNSHGDSRGTHGRGRTPSSASETAVLRDEVVDLLALARKASSGGVTSTSSSSSSLSPINRDFNSIDMTRSTSSASAHTGGDSLSPPHSATSGTFSRTRLAAPGTASKEELEALARSVSPAFNAPPPILKPTKKKFGGLFGGGKKGEAAAGAKGSPTFPTAWQNQARTDVSQRSPSPLPPPSCAMPSTDRNIRAAPLQGAQDRSHRAPPVAGSHRYQMTAQHRRKRSMSVGDASAFLPTPLAATGDTRKPRPAVYDESYFSNLKQPYCSTSLGEGSQKRANQIARLGIVEDVDGKLSAAGQEQEEETLANAKERLLAQARTAIGHPSAHQKRQGQLLFQGETGDLHLTAKSHPSQTTWTSPLQQAESRTARNNSDASILDPFLPAGHQSNKPRGPMHLTVPVAGSVNGRISPDSLAAIGPPPASPLPSPPRTSSTLPGVPNAARPMHAVSRTPSPSQRMHLPPARSPAPTSPLPPLPAAICPAPVQRAVKEPSLSPPQPKRSPPAVPAASADKTEYDFEFRPHRTKQQGRPRLSPLQERVASPIESPSLDKMAVPARPFGTRGIVQRPPSALDMTLVPSPSPSSAAASSSAATSSSASSTKSLAASTSTSSIPTPKAREFNQAQIRRRQETESTLASQYSTEGEFEGYDPSRSSGSSAVSSSTTGNSMHASGVSSHASHTTLSSTTSYSSNSSMTSYNSSSSCLSRPSLSMDGHSTEDEMSVSSHAGGGFVHVNMAVPMKPPKRGMVPSPSTESINNLAGIGLAKGQYPHSRRMHFGWNKHKAMHDLASHAEDVELGHSGDDENAIRVLQRDMIQGNISEEGVSSPGSEDDAYAGIIADYGTSKQHQGNDEGYIGSSPELVSTGKGLSKSHGMAGRQKIVTSRYPIKQARSSDHLRSYR